MQKDLLRRLMIKIGEVMILLNRSVAMKIQIRNLRLSGEGASVLSPNFNYRTRMMSLIMWASYSRIKRAGVALVLLLQAHSSFS